MILAQVSLWEVTISGMFALAGVLIGQCSGLFLDGLKQLHDHTISKET